MNDDCEDAPVTFDIGDGVVTLYDIGLLRPRVPRGTAGIVAGRRADASELEIHFANGRVELVSPHTLAPVQGQVNR